MAARFNRVSALEALLRADARGEAPPEFVRRHEATGVPPDEKLTVR